MCIFVGRRFDRCANDLSILLREGGRAGTAEDTAASAITRSIESSVPTPRFGIPRSSASSSPASHRLAEALTE